METYLLMHKNRPAAEIGMLSGRPFKIEKVLDYNELPVGFYLANQQAQSALLDSWYKSRTIPNGRPNLDKILSALGTSRAEAFLKSSGISLTDSFWFKEKDNPLRWEDVNFHDNGFEPVFAEYYMNGGDCKFSPSPDFSTDGVLEKFWISSYGVPFLVKMDQQHNGVQAANEVVASRIATKLGINAVQYTHAIIGDHHACMCKSFITDSESDFINGLQLRYTAIGKKFDMLSMLPKEASSMILFDVLLGNEDRHEKNFGLIRKDNSDVLSPIFDSGTCLNFDSNYSNVELKFPRIARNQFNSELYNIDKDVVKNFESIRLVDLEEILYIVYNDFEIDKDTYTRAKSSLEYGFDIVEKSLSKSDREQDDFEY